MSQDTIEKVQNFYKKYQHTRIFLNEETCESIESAIRAIEHPSNLYSGFIRNYDDDELHTLTDVRELAWKEMHDKLPSALEKLEEEFRSILCANKNLNT